MFVTMGGVLEKNRLPAIQRVLMVVSRPEAQARLRR